MIQGGVSPLLMSGDSLCFDTLLTIVNFLLSRGWSSNDCLALVTKMSCSTEMRCFTLAAIWEMLTGTPVQINSIGDMTAKILQPSGHRDQKKSTMFIQNKSDESAIMFLIDDVKGIVHNKIKQLASLRVVHSNICSFAILVSTAGEMLAMTRGYTQVYSYSPRAVFPDKVEVIADSIFPVPGMGFVVFRTASDRLFIYDCLNERTIQLNSRYEGKVADFKVIPSSPMGPIRIFILTREGRAFMGDVNLDVYHFPTQFLSVHELFVGSLAGKRITSIEHVNGVVQFGWEHKSNGKCGYVDISENRPESLKRRRKA